MANENEKDPTVKVEFTPSPFNQKDIPSKTPNEALEAEVKQFDDKDLSEFRKHVMNKQSEYETSKNKPTEGKVEAKQEVKQEVKSETKPGEQVTPPASQTTPPTPQATPGLNMDEVLAKTEERVMERIKREAEEADKEEIENKPNSFVKMTDEEAQTAYNNDPALYIKNLQNEMGAFMEKSLVDKVSKIIDDKLSQNVALKTANKRDLEAYKTQAESMFPEFKNPVEQAKLEKLMMSNLQTLETERKAGRNPFVKLMKLYQVDNLDAIIKNAKQEGIKETEERLQKANRAVVEGSGKTPEINAGSVESIVNLPLKDMEKKLKELGA